MKTRWLFILVLVASIVSLPACIYRVDIPQGYRINGETIVQLKVGMSKRQVEFLLGEPAIRDTYRPDTWHYVYFLKSGDSGSIEKRVMILRFDGEILTSIEGSLHQS